MRTWTRRLLSVAVWTLGILALVVALALAWVWQGSERILGRHWEVPPTEVTVSSDPAAAERGHHIAQTRGCFSCHGERLEGGVFFDLPHVARLVPPNLPRLARESSVADLERSIRHGVNPRGTTVRGMPSETFFELTDEDLGDLIAFLRALPVVDQALPSTEIRLLGRVGLVTGKYVLAPQLIDPAQTRRPPAAPGDVRGLGRYLARTTCVECHGRELHGDEVDDVRTPDLALVASYSRDQFSDLMRQGKAVAGNPLKLMAEVARARFAHFDDAELDALYAYLSGLADPTADRR